MREAGSNPLPTIRTARTGAIGPGGAGGPKQGRGLAAEHLRPRLPEPETPEGRPCAEGYWFMRDVLGTIRES